MNGSRLGINYLISHPEDDKLSDISNIKNSFALSQDLTYCLQIRLYNLIPPRKTASIRCSDDNNDVNNKNNNNSLVIP